MQHYFSVWTDAAGVVYIDRQTGVIFWEQEDLNPVLKQRTTKYLIDEGFLEQALGTLEHLPDREIGHSFEERNHDQASTTMGNGLAPEIRGRPGVRAWLAKLSFSKQLAGVSRDLEGNQRWKYDELSPVQLLEKLRRHEYLAKNDELERAEYFWSRRPRFFRPICYVVWLIVALGLPFWLFSVPAIGLPLFIVSAVLVNTDIVRTARWRRQYELSIDRLIRTKSTLSRRNNSK
jgi:hypothetical protein